MSAFQLADNQYETLLDILRSVYGNPQTRSDFRSIPLTYWKGLNEYDTTGACVALVKALAQLNADSVNYRYSDSEGSEDTRDLNKKLDAQAKRPTNQRFAAYAKLGDWVDLAGFMQCWDYQSCEIDNMTDKQTELMKWAEDFQKSALYMGCRKQMNRRPAWGYLAECDVLTADRTTKVISLSELAAAKRK